MPTENSKKEFVSAWTNTINKFVILRESLPEVLQEDLTKAVSLLQSLVQVASNHVNEEDWKNMLTVRLRLYATKWLSGEVNCYGVIQDEIDNHKVRTFLEENTGLRNHPGLRLSL